MVPPKAWKPGNAPGADIDNIFLVFPTLGWGTAVFGFRRIQKESSEKNVQNEVVHHTDIIGTLLTWFECLIGH